MATTVNYVERTTNESLYTEISTEIVNALDPKKSKEPTQKRLCFNPPGECDGGNSKRTHEERNRNPSTTGNNGISFTYIKGLFVETETNKPPEIIVYVRNNDGKLIGFALVSKIEENDRIIRIRLPSITPKPKINEKIEKNNEIFGKYNKYIGSNEESAKIGSFGESNLSSISSFKSGPPKNLSNMNNFRIESIPESLYIKIICGSGSASSIIGLIEEIGRNQNIGFISLHALKAPMMTYYGRYEFQFAEVNQSQHPVIGKLTNLYNFIFSLGKSLEELESMCSTFTKIMGKGPYNINKMKCDILELIEFKLVELGLYDSSNNANKCSPFSCAGNGYTMYKKIESVEEKQRRDVRKRKGVFVVTNSAGPSPVRKTEEPPPAPQNTIATRLRSRGPPQ
tara:strand:- start:21611 stop:22801 length:1191 start_codon:yes stop_codon:yes gene_type:complete